MTNQTSPIDPAQLDQLRQSHLGRLLLRAYRAFSLQAVEKLRQRGYSGLALTHTMLLANIDASGTRLTSLAEQMGITRQAVSHLVQELEQQGYVTRESDPADRRAAIVALTPSGWQLLRDVVEAKTELERDYSAALGEGQIAALRDLLARVSEPIG